MLVGTSSKQGKQWWLGAFESRVLTHCICC